MQVIVQKGQSKSLVFKTGQLVRTAKGNLVLVSSSAGCGPGRFSGTLLESGEEHSRFILGGNYTGWIKEGAVLFTGKVTIFNGVEHDS